MKKLVTLLLAAGLVLSAANGASAVEVKASGSMDFAFDYGMPGNNFMTTKDYDRNTKSAANAHNKHFGAVQRMRLNLDFIASENLSAHYQAQVGTFTWGGPAAGLTTGMGDNTNENAGGALGTRAANIVTRLAYLDWMIPNTDVKVRMGQQPVAMPSYVFGSPVLDDTATGIVISAPVTENIGITGGWIRAYSDARRGSAMLGTTSATDDTLDLFTLNANFKYDGFQISPWLLMGPMGKNANLNSTLDGKVSGLQPLWGFNSMQNSKSTATVKPSKLSNSFVWFAGLGGELTMFDPFRFAGDFYYSANDTGHSYSDRSGWFLDGSVEYKTAYGTPGLKAWYSSGDDKKASNGSERPLALSGAFNPTLNYFDGRFGIGDTIDNSTANGTWGVGLYWNGLSFVENLTHDFGVTYFQGNNATVNVTKYKINLTPSEYMTTKDSAIELDFTSTYNIYQNLATALELSYIFQNFDGKTWGRSYGLTNVDGSLRKAEFSNIFRATLNFQYKF